MSDPKLTGNVSDELGQYEGGKDFENVNQSAFPADVPALDVDVKKLGNDLLIVPKVNGNARGIGEMEAGLRDQLAAQVFEDPSMMHPARNRMVKKSSQRGNLVWYAISGEDGIAMSGDRVLIRRDTLESAYSCRKCKAKGHSDIQCPTCKGSCVDIDGSSTCRSCQVLGYDRESKHASGFIPCEFCSGSGWAGGIVRPETTQTAPIAGIIVSHGPDCVDFFTGDRVIYSKYAGHTNEMPNGDAYTVMHEHEVLSLTRKLIPNA